MSLAFKAAASIYVFGRGYNPILNTTAALLPLAMLKTGQASYLKGED